MDRDVVLHIEAKHQLELAKLKHDQQIARLKLEFAGRY